MTTGVSEGRLTCRKCGGPLHAREGRYILKYSLWAYRNDIPCDRAAVGFEASPTILLGKEGGCDSAVKFV
jgi:hypothetical protein